MGSMRKTPSLPRIARSQVDSTSDPAVQARLNVFLIGPKKSHTHPPTHEDKSLRAVLVCYSVSRISAT